MKKSKQSGKSPVRRLTIDERLGNNKIRLLISEPVEEIEDLANADCDIWKDERMAVCNCTDFMRELGIGKDEKLIAIAVKEIGLIDKKFSAGDFFNHAIKEGQVFLVGRFKIEGDRHNPERIIPGEGSEDFLRIDRIDLFKHGLGNLYNETAIQGGD